jgi:hypothetical protein
MTIRSEIHLRVMPVRRESQEESMDILVEPKTAFQEDDTEDADKKYESASRHLIDRDGCVQKADIH